GTTMPRNQPTIVISIHGGIMQDVFCSQSDTRVILVDWDQEGQNLGLPGIIEVQCDGKPVIASVVEYGSASFDAMKDTDLARALEAAHLQGQLDQPVIDL